MAMGLYGIQLLWSIKTIFTVGVMFASRLLKGLESPHHIKVRVLIWSLLISMTHMNIR